MDLHPVHNSTRLIHANRRADTSETNFMVATWDTPTSLKLEGTGSGGLAEMKSMLPSNDVAYGLLREKFNWESVGGEIVRTFVGATVAKVLTHCPNLADVSADTIKVRMGDSVNLRKRTMHFALYFNSLTSSLHSLLTTPIFARFARRYAHRSSSLCIGSQTLECH